MRRHHSEVLSEQFYSFELRGRGWIGMPYPVVLEPPFQPFRGFVLPPPVDDGRRPTMLSSFADWLSGRKTQKANAFKEPLPEGPDPERFESTEPLVEFLLAVPPRTGIGHGASESLLRALRSCSLPLSFEIVGEEGQLAMLLSARASDAPLVEHQVRAFFPDVVLVPDAEGLRRTWDRGGAHLAISEFGLAREFMIPLERHRQFDPDPLLPLLATLATLNRGEIGVVQLLFQAVRRPWGESALRAVFGRDGKPFFADAPELAAATKEKARQPLFAVVLRLAARSPDPDSAGEIIWKVAGALRGFGSPGGNDLVPLSLEEGVDLEDDLLARQTHRSGMLLGSDELVSLVHLPGPSIRLPELRRAALRTKAAPASTRTQGIVLGENRHRGEVAAVHWPPEVRIRHAHVIGASGSGKSTLLVRMIAADIEAGSGVAVLDPHGDLIDAVISRLPEERLKDVLLFDPSDEEALVGWNILAASSELEKTLLASDLVGVFRRLSTSWGDQMTGVLANAILVFLDSTEGGTLLDLRQFLVDKAFRERFLATVPDPDLRFYWQHEFPLLVGKPQGSILMRLDTLLRSKLVRRIVGSRENRLDLRQVIDRGQVFLGKLSQGAIGEENAALLGSLLVSKFHQVAQSRQDTAPKDRRPFTLYVDEAQHFATASMAGLLSGARKYSLSLVAAHQELSQLKQREPEVASALLTNAGTRIVFRVGEDDARHLERGFSFFEAADLTNLAVGEAVCRVGRSEDDFNLATAPLEDVPETLAESRRARLLAITRSRFAPPKGRESAPPAAPPQPSPVAVIEPPAPAQAVQDEGKASRPRRIAPAPAPAPLGRGGPEHQYLQELVKRWAEARGYRATIEHALAGGGSVDVLLEREGTTLACEISVTTSVEQEVGNIEKCLAAGFSEVALISLKKQLLAKVKTALAKRVPHGDLGRVLFLTPEELSSLLDATPAATRSDVVGGYKVRVSYQPTEVAEGEARRRAVSEVIARSLRRVKNCT